MRFCMVKANFKLLHWSLAHHFVLMFQDTLCLNLCSLTCMSPLGISHICVHVFKRYGTNLSLKQGYDLLLIIITFLSVGIQATSVHVKMKKSILQIINQYYI